MNFKNYSIFGLLLTFSIIFSSFQTNAQCDLEHFPTLGGQITGISYDRIDVTYGSDYTYITVVNPFLHNTSYDTVGGIWQFNWKLSKYEHGTYSPFQKTCSNTLVIRNGVTWEGWIICNVWFYNYNARRGGQSIMLTPVYVEIPPIKPAPYITKSKKGG